ncbi:MAG: hypothetical protein WCI30_04360 [Clostridia bacterium]
MEYGKTVIVDIVQHQQLASRLAELGLDSAFFDEIFWLAGQSAAWQKKWRESICLPSFIPSFSLQEGELYALGLVKKSIFAKDSELFFLVGLEQTIIVMHNKKSELLHLPVLAELASYAFAGGKASDPCAGAVSAIKKTLFKEEISQSQLTQIYQNGLIAENLQQKLNFFGKIITEYTEMNLVAASIKDIKGFSLALNKRADGQCFAMLFAKDNQNA